MTNCTYKSTNEELATLRAELEEMKRNYEGACKTVAEMHAAAVGEITGPKRGVVEDVADLRAELEKVKRERDVFKAEMERVKDVKSTLAEQNLELVIERDAARAEVERLTNATRAANEVAAHYEAQLARMREALEWAILALQVGANAERDAYEFKDEWRTDCEKAMDRARAALTEGEKP